MSAAWELQKAIYTTLKNDAALMVLVDDVYEHVVQDAAYPFVAIEVRQVSNWSARTVDGRELQINIHALVRERGSKRAFDILDRVDALLHDQPLTLGGGVFLINLRRGTASVTLRSDGLTYQGIAGFRAIVQES